MLDKTYYFTDILRKVNLAMINLFGGLQVAKRDNKGNILEFRAVPIRFVHKQKFIPYLTDNLEANKMWFNQHLPQIALFIKNITYNPEKVRGGFDSPIYNYVDMNSNTQRIFSGSPWKISYSLGIISMHMSEMSMILEQVLPQFNPYKNITIQEWDFLPSLTRDLKVLCGGTVQPNFMDEVPEEAFKKIEFEIPFDVDCNFYLPIQISDIIKYVKLDLGILETQTIETTYNFAVSGLDINDYNVLPEWVDPVTLVDTVSGWTDNVYQVSGGEEIISNTIEPQISGDYHELPINTTIIPSVCSEFYPNILP